MNKNIIIGIVAVVLIGGGIYWYIQSQSSTSNTLPYRADTVIPPPPAAAPASVPAPTSTTKTTPGVQVYNVTIQNFAFSPKTISVKKGDTVIWTNMDSTPHTITGNNGGPASSPFGINGTYSFQFNDVGTFGYHCAPHPSMTGTVTVTQ